VPIETAFTQFGIHVIAFMLMPLPCERLAKGKHREETKATRKAARLGGLSRRSML